MKWGNNTLWSGYGFLVLALMIVDGVVFELLSRPFMNADSKYYETNTIPIGISSLVSAIIIRFLSKYFAKKKAEKMGTRIFDTVTIAQGGKFFFIPFAYWSYILACWGFLSILWQLIQK
jgi:hypothetical protein